MSLTKHQSAHRALLNLERSADHPIELLEEAASILGVQFNNIEDELLRDHRDEQPRESPIFAPKEEWALRWLLKKTKPGAINPPTGETGSSANDEPRKWLLFYYLVCRTPVKQLAKVFREQDALQQVQDALGQLAKGLKDFSAMTALQRKPRPDSDELCYDDYQSPQGGIKKRKRSPASEEPLGEGNSTALIIISILQAMKVCLDYALTTEGKDLVSEQHMQLALGLSPEKAATTLNHIFRLVTSVFKRTTRPSIRDSLLSLLNSASRLWLLSHGPERGHSADESNQIFTSQCLASSLSLLHFISEFELTDQRKDLKAWLEQVIARHAVEPARRFFFGELASKWNSDEDPLLPESIKLAIERLHAMLFPYMTVGAQPADLNDFSPSFSLLSPILLDIAIRSCPRSTVRKAQYEQPWLEAFFVCLARLGGCSLMREERAAQGEDDRKVERNDYRNGDSDHDRKFVACLDPLLSTVMQWKLSLSLPLLSSLALKFAAFRQSRPANWSIVLQIMQLNINVFLPNSGISTAKGLLDQLVGSLEDESNILTRDSLPMNHDLIVDIVILLMNGFASARDLTTFTKIWMDRLEATEASRLLSIKKAESANPHSLWDDEDVIAAFARVAKISATPKFVESHLLTTTEALREKNFGGKQYALILVTDVLLNTYGEDSDSIQDSLIAFYDVLQHSIYRYDHSSRIQGWLWRLLRCVFICSGKSPPLMFRKLFAREEPLIIETAFQNVKQGPPSYSRSMQNFSQVERFHCFVTMVASQPTVASEYFDMEIDSLAHQVSILHEKGVLEGRLSFAPLWDGKAATLATHADLLAAFLGILLQNSQVLCLNIDRTITLMKALSLHFTAESEGHRETQSGLEILFEGLLCNEALVGTPDFVKKCIKAVGLIDGNKTNDKAMALFQSLPKEAFSKAQRKDIMEWQHERAMAFNEMEADPEKHSTDSAEIQSQHFGVLHSGSELTYGNLQRSCTDARAAAAFQTKENVISLCESLCKESPSFSTFLLLGTMLNRGDTIFPHMANLAIDLSALLPKSPSLETFCITADCIKIILDKHPKCINQWTIDSLLASLAITSTARGPHIGNASPIIFERLCRLLGTILGRYRIRLGGRYHLLLPILYHLLRCLYATDPRSLTTQAQLLFYSKLPPWVHSSSTTTTTPLSKESSIHLTRILTSICDPTPSAVKRTNNPLTDETKKARDIAGQYMQYFIAEFAHCQLHGRIGVDVKAGLMPGLYAVMDVMVRDVMRGLNAKMDASQRAIFKGLYEDYMRFGRWNGV